MVWRQAAGLEKSAFSRTVRKRCWPGRRLRSKDSNESPARTPKAASSSGLAAALGDPVGLVDDDDVPGGVFQKDAVLVLLLQRVDRDDRAVEVVERVGVGGQEIANPLDPGGIEPYEGDGEA